MKNFLDGRDVIGLGPYGLFFCITGIGTREI